MSFLLNRANGPVVREADLNGAAQTAKWRSDGPNYRRWLLVVLVLAFMVRLPPVFRPGVDWAKNNAADANGYLQLAAGLRNHCGFARLTGSTCSVPEILRTPGYPVLLAVVPSLRASLVLQAMMGTLVALFVAELIVVRFGAAWALVGAALVALDVTSIVWATQVMSEVPFQLLSLAAVAQLWNPRNMTGRARPMRTAVLSGTLLACAILFRPAGLVLIPTIAILLLFLPMGPQHRSVLVALYLLPSVLVYSGWTYRNSSVAGVATFSAISHKNLYFYRAAEVVQKVDGNTPEQTAELLLRRLQAPACFSIQSEGFIGCQSAETLARMNRFGTELLLSYPLLSMKLFVTHLAYLIVTPGLTDVRLWLGDPQAGYHIKEEGSKLQSLLTMSRPIRAAVALQWILILVTWVGIVALLRTAVRYPWRDRLWLLTPLIVGMALLAAAAGPEGGARLRVPAVPFLVIAAATGFATMRGQLSAHRSLKE